MSLSRALKCNLTHDEKHNTDQVQLLFFIRLLPGFQYSKKKRGRKRKEKREEEINKFNKAVETMTEVNRNLAQDGQRLLHTWKESARTRTRT